jgi:hypothetical protein
MSINQISRKWYEEWADFFISQEDRLHPGDMQRICINENFLPEFFFRFKKNWKWYYMSQNPNLTLSFIEKNLDKHWNLKLGRNPVITPKFVNDHPEIEWSFEELSYNPSTYTDLSFVERNIGKLNQRELLKFAPVHFLLSMNLDYFLGDKFWSGISSNPSIDTSFLIENLDKRWNWILLSSNPAISISFISDHLLLPWYWEFVGARVTPEFVEKYHDFSWDWMILSRNPSILPLVHAHPDWPWNWGLLSSNKGLTINDVTSLPDKSWSWSELSKKLPLKDILDHQQLSWFDLGRNPTINVSFIKKTFFQPWFIQYITENGMRQAREEYITTKTKEWLKKVKDEIEQQLIEVTWNPDRLRWIMDNEQKEKWGIMT